MRESAHAGALDSWSSLIRPTSEWTRRGAWSRRSQAVHGITHEMLAEAPPPATVFAELNRRVADFDILFCDGGSYDAHWLRELCRAAAAPPAFRMADISILLGLGPYRRNRYSDLLAASAAPHRAEADARRIAETVVKSR